MKLLSSMEDMRLIDIFINSIVIELTGALVKYSLAEIINSINAYFKVKTITLSY